jgi:hypothetical protein
MTLAEVDLPDMIRGNSPFAGNYAHQIADLHAVAGADCHKETRHSAAVSARTLALRRPWTSSGWRIRLGHAPLCSLALEQVEGGRGELEGVELFEQRLQ